MGAIRRYFDVRRHLGTPLCSFKAAAHLFRGKLLVQNSNFILEISIIDFSDFRSKIFGAKIFGRSRPAWHSDERYALHVPAHLCFASF
jgi:hypothetical protein